MYVWFHFFFFIFNELIFSRFQGELLGILLNRLTGYMIRGISLLPGHIFSFETQGIRK